MPESLADIQFAFAGHIRNPEQVAAPGGIEARRMQIYRELFFNNISKFLAGNFPVLRRLHTKESWACLVREFYTEHRAHTPLFPELPKEFLRYVQEQRLDRAGDPPFLFELAHYEWTELALSLDPVDLGQIKADRHGDLLDGVPVLSPLAWPLSYRFPVHLIKPEFQPTEAPAEMTYLLVYRNIADTVKFMKLNQVTRLLLEQMQKNPVLRGRELLVQAAATIKHPDPESVVSHGARLLNDLRERDVILGTAPPG